MKAFILKAVILCLAAVLILTVIFFFELKEKNYYSLASHEMNVKLCAERLDTMKNVPKIIFIGGSGCGFGIDSRAISLHFQMPVVNTGTHANIGLRLQMEIFKKYISNGDVVVVIPEYDQFSNLFYLGGNETVLRILNSYEEGYASCPLWQKIYISQFIPKYYEQARSTGPCEPDDTPYSINSLNEYGDVTAYEQRMNGNLVTVYKALDNYNPLVKKYILKYKSFIEGLDAKLILLPPALAQSSYNNSAAFIEGLLNRYNNNDIQLFDDKPLNCSLPDSLYYDTPYHLTTLGVMIRTEQLIKQIETALLRDSVPKSVSSSGLATL